VSRLLDREKVVEEKVQMLCKFSTFTVTPRFHYPGWKLIEIDLKLIEID